MIPTSIGTLLTYATPYSVLHDTLITSVLFCVPRGKQKQKTTRGGGADASGGGEGGVESDDPLDKERISLYE